MELQDFIGTTSQALVGAVDKERNAPPVSSFFFKPYTSPLNILGRTTSIVTDLLLIEGFSAYFALDAGWELLKGFKNLITKNPEESARQNFSDAGVGIAVSAFLFIAAVLSPLINLVDLIAGAVNTLKQINQNEEETANNITPF